MTQTGSFVTVCAAVCRARLASLGLRCSCLAAEGCLARTEVLAAANWAALHSYSSAAVDTAVVLRVAAAGVGEGEAVASIGPSVAAACGYSAHTASVALAAVRAVLERDSAKLLDLVCHVWTACTRRVGEGRVEDPVAQAHCNAAAAAAAWIEREALLRRRRGAQRADRTA